MFFIQESIVWYKSNIGLQPYIVGYWALVLEQSFATRLFCVDKSIHFLVIEMSAMISTQQSMDIAQNLGWWDLE